MAGKTKKPSVIKLILKTVLAVSGCIFLFLLSVLTISDFSDNVVDYEDDVASMIDYCNWRYYDRDYGSLRDELTLYNLYSEEFDKYWEIVDCYELYLECLEYRAIPGEKQKAEELQAEMSEMAANCRFEENRRQIESFSKALNEES